MSELVVGDRVCACMSCGSVIVNAAVDVGPVEGVVEGVVGAEVV